jgi:type IV pilus assembly protein PilA
MAHRLHRTASMMRRSDERGFTLVEMAVVVVIIGILAVLAVVGYRKLITDSHTTEATQMIQAIRVAQESYHSEVQLYADISPDLGANSMFPRAPTQGVQYKTQWGGTCASGQCKNTTPQWKDLPVHADGSVMFGYATTAGLAGGAPTITSFAFDGQTLTFPGTSTNDWYMIAAHGFPDGNTEIWGFGTSWNNDVIVMGN